MSYWHVKHTEPEGAQSRIAMSYWHVQHTGPEGAQSRIAMSYWHVYALITGRIQFKVLTTLTLFYLPPTSTESCYSAILSVCPGVGSRCP